MTGAESHSGFCEASSFKLLKSEYGLGMLIDHRFCFSYLDSSFDEVDGLNHAEILPG